MTRRPCCFYLLLWWLFSVHTNGNFLDFKHCRLVSSLTRNLEAHNRFRVELRQEDSRLGPESCLLPLVKYRTFLDLDVGSKLTEIDSPNVNLAAESFAHVIFLMALAKANLA